MSKSHAMFATAPRGLEELLADELAGLGLAEVRVRRGGAGFESTLAGAYRACLWSRVANRILLPLAEFEADDDEGLYAGVRSVDWTEHLGPENTLAVDFTGIKASISHSRFAEQRVKDAVVDQLRDATGERPSVDTAAPDVRINVHMHASQVTGRRARPHRSRKTWPRQSCSGAIGPGWRARAAGSATRCAARAQWP